MTRKVSVFWVLVMLVLAIAVTVWIWVSGRKNGSLDAAAILPADTIFLFEASDVISLGKRLNQTAIARFFKEPEIARILAPLRARAGASRPLNALSVFGNAAKIRHIFLAQVSVNKGVAIIGGLESAANRSALLGELKKLNETLGTGFDLDGQPVRRHNAHAIFTGSLGRLPIEVALVGNGCFFGTNPDALDGFLDRVDLWKSKGEEPDSLASAKEVATAVSTLPGDWDTRILLQPRHWAASNAPVAAKWFPGLSQKWNDLPQLIALTSKIDGRIFRDAVYVPGDSGKKWPILPSKQPAFRNTALDLRLSIDAVTDARQLPTLQLGRFTVLDEVRRRLLASSVTRREWTSAFGPEVRLAILWPKESGMPVFELTCQVRDGAKAREVFKRLGDEMTTRADVRRETVQNQEVILIPSGESLLYTPAMMLEPAQLRIVSNVDDLAIIQRERQAGHGVEKKLKERSPKTELAENLVILHVDSVVLAGRAYQFLRPALTLAVQMSPNRSRSFDWRRLPEVEVVTRNLQPMDLTLRRAGNGLVTESSGPLTVPQLIVASWAIQNGMNR